MNWRVFWEERSEEDPLKEHCCGLETPEKFARRCSSIASVLGLGKETRFLDAGCGNGEMLKEFVAQGFLEEKNCVGVDVSERLLVKARKKLPLAAFYRVDLGVEELPFEDNRFDSSLCYSVTHYLRSAWVEAMIWNLLRVTKGLVLVGNVAPPEEFFRAHPVLGRLAYPFRRFYGGSVNYIGSAFFERFNPLRVIRFEDTDRFDVLLGGRNKNGL